MNAYIQYFREAIEELEEGDIISFNRKLDNQHFKMDLDRLRQLGVSYHLSKFLNRVNTNKYMSLLEKEAYDDHNLRLFLNEVMENIRKDEALSYDFDLVKERYAGSDTKDYLFLGKLLSLIKGFEVSLAA